MTSAAPVISHVVGIGASAGGITALESLFHALPTNPNLAFVVIQHLAPGQPSRLVDLLSNWSAMPVRQAVDGDRPERNRVYIASPDDVLTLEGGEFRTRRRSGFSQS